jgi:hypothetical protein
MPPKAASKNRALRRYVQSTPAACRKLNACLPSFVRFASKTCPAAAFGAATIPYASKLAGKQRQQELSNRTPADQRPYLKVKLKIAFAIFLTFCYRTPNASVLTHT